MNSYEPPLSPGFRFVLRLLGAIVLVMALLSVAGCATAPPQAKGVNIPPEVTAQCDAEGGCSLITAKRLQSELEAAFLAGVMAAQQRKGPGA